MYCDCIVIGLWLYCDCVACHCIARLCLHRYLKWNRIPIGNPRKNQNQNQNQHLSHNVNQEGDHLIHLMVIILFQSCFVCLTLSIRYHSSTDPFNPLISLIPLAYSGHGSASTEISASSLLYLQLLAQFLILPHAVLLVVPFLSPIHPQICFQRILYLSAFIQASLVLKVHGVCYVWIKPFKPIK